MQFLEAEKRWIIPNVFGGKNLAKIAHGLAGTYLSDKHDMILACKSQQKAMVNNGAIKFLISINNSANQRRYRHIPDLLKTRSVVTYHIYNA